MEYDLEQIKRDMKLWRSGWFPMPKAYIDLHHDRAVEDLDRFADKHGVMVVDTRMVPDGWFDGMRVLEVVTVDLVGNDRIFRWSDANGGSWFERYQHCGGQGLVEKAPNAPGYL